MKYTINRTKRNVIILSSSLLILYVLIIRLYFFFIGPTKIDTLQIVVQKIFFLVPYIYLMLSFFSYFRYHKLKVLQMSIITMLIMDVILRANLLTNIFDPTLKQAFFFATNAIWIIATIILVIFLFQIKKKDFPGILSIRKYAISAILLFVLAPTITFVIKPDNRFAIQQLVELTSVIPYFFTIDFAIKLYAKE